MARKRNQLLDESDLDSDSNASSDDQVDFNDRDLQDEHSLFDDPYGLKRRTNKKRRMNDPKAEAIYGVFAQEADLNQPNIKNSDKRLHKVQTFVKASSQDPSKDNKDDVENSSSEDEDSDSDGSSDSSDSSNSSNPSKSKLNEIQETDSPPIPSTSGLGSKPGLGSSASNDDFRAMLGSATRPALGGQRGLGFQAGNPSSPIPTAESSDQNNNESKDTDSRESTLPRRSFLGAQQSNPSQQTVKKKPLSKAEQQHFAKLANSKTASIGMKLLQNMGWKAGTGLGMQGEGIVTPLETKARPKGMGLSFKGFEERTNQAKEEDRRNGKTIDDDDQPSKQKGKKDKPVREAWKAKPKTTKKTKTVHRTYEQIISELNPDQMGLDPGVGEIIDLTGRKLPSLNTTLTQHVKGPTEEEQEHRLPELMHNLALICDISKGNLINLAKEGQAIKQKSEQLAKDRARSEHILKVQQQKLEDLKQILKLTQSTKTTYLDILDAIDETTPATEICMMMDRFDELFYKLFEFFSKDLKSESQAMKLDEIIVSALAPILRKVWNRWDVLGQPTLSTPELKRFRKCFLLESSSQSISKKEDNFRHPLFPTPPNGSGLQSNRKMTAYESLIWNDWLPKIRSAVNVWSPYQSDEMIMIYKTWKSLLPQFVHDNFLDQLIVPKLLTWIQNWDFREQLTGLHSTRPNSRRVSLHLFVFPWLELVGPYRSQLILAEVKMKLSDWMKSWQYTSKESPEEGLMIQDLLVWKQDVIKRREWDKLILKTIVPHLASYLRKNLVINPRNQDLRPFQVMLNWAQLITNQEMLNQLLMKEFFSKWIETLWVWLTAPTANSEQIGEWYNWWKSLFPEDLLTNRSIIVSSGFAKGQELMNQAKSLSSSGADLQSQLPKPDLITIGLTDSKSRPSSRGGQDPGSLESKKPTSRLEEITFKSIVEEEVEKKNLFLIPLGKTLDSNGLSLFKVSNQFNSKTKDGLIISISDDVVFVKNPSAPTPSGDHQSYNEDDWEPMLIEDMLVQALAAVNKPS